MTIAQIVPIETLNSAMREPRYGGSVVLRVAPDAAKALIAFIDTAKERAEAARNLASVLRGISRYAFFLSKKHRDQLTAGADFLDKLAAALA